MTLDEAIKHYEQLAENQIKCADRIDELHCDSTTTRYMAEHHRQLAEWLKELKAYREILENADKIIKSKYGCVIIEGYADIIDKMNEVYKERVIANDNDE